MCVYVCVWADVCLFTSVHKHKYRHVSKSDCEYVCNNYENRTVEQAIVDLTSFSYMYHSVSVSLNQN